LEWWNENGIIVDDDDDALMKLAAGRPQDFVWCLCDAWKENIQQSRTRTRSSDDFSEVQHGSKDRSPSDRRPTLCFGPPRVGVGVVVEAIDHSYKTSMM
jgi:hypothetical protein